MTETRTGRCACGAVSFQAPDDPLFVNCCHCTYCQRESGASFGLNFLIEADRVSWSGEVEEVLTDSASGKGQRILRCSHCKVALSSHYPGLGEVVHFLRVGTFEDSSGISPGAHLYTATKQEWLTLDPDIPAYEDFYKTREAWPEASVTRVKKALGR